MKKLEKQDLLQNGVIDASLHTLDGIYEVHRHDFFEIEYILAGSGDYAINGTHHAISPGKLFFMTPADFHTVEACGLVLINLMFTPTQETADALFSLTVQHPSPVFQLTETARLLIELLLHEITEAVKNTDTAYAMRLSSVLLFKLARIEPKGAPAACSYVRDTVLYLLSHFTEPITLSDTAKHLGLSKNYLSELFHEQTGMGLKEYLDELRFDYIAKLLICSPLPISEIAAAGGFSDYANFVRRFKKKYAMSPSAWRKNAETRHLYLSCTCNNDTIKKNTRESENLDMKSKLFTSADILLPKENFESWAVIACDQFTSNAEYWKKAEELTQGHPSALRLIYPEYYLGKTDPNAVTEEINRTMREYLSGNVYRRYSDAMIYIERIQSDGRMRAGIVGAVDLDAYDYTPGSKAAVRATEATVLERIPPRVAIRRDAPTELPHVMMLLDDRKCEIIEPLAALAAEGKMEKIYDFDLMQGGGHLTGYLIPKELQARISEATEALGALHGGMSMAVGDGNHSLATAKECRHFSPNDKNKYALCELVNLYSPALSFEPIYRTVEQIDPKALLAAFHTYLEMHADQSSINAPQDITFVTDSDRKTIHVEHPPHALAVGTVQAFLDAYLPTISDAVIDYIHGEEEVEKVVSHPNACGFLYDCMKKEELFSAVEREGVLPRKTFSMGHARDKRYYMEVKEIK